MVQRCSNGVGFVVLEPEPAFNTGISIEVYDAAEPDNLIDVVPDSFDRKWTDPREGTGAGEFKVFVGNPHLEANPTLLRAGNIVRMYLDRIPRFAFKIEKRQLVQIQEGEDSRVAWHITGRGVLSLLEDGQIWPAGGLGGDPERPFDEATPGEVLSTLVGEAQARSNSILAQITEDYTAGLDSNNVPYDINVTLEERAGTDLLRVAERITELAADVYMTPLLELRIVNSRGVDRTIQTNDVGPVVLQKGSNIIELERSEDAVIRNALLIETPGGFVERIEGASITEYRRRESFLSLGNITDSSQIDRAAAAIFERSANPAEGITIRVTDTEGRRPYADFGPGDWVLAPDIEGALERYRVTALTITETRSGHIEAIPELATITDDLEERLNKWLKSMARGTMGGTAADVSEPNRAPAEVINAVEDGIDVHEATFLHPDELSDLADTDVTGLEAGDALLYNAGTGKWEPETLELDVLEDVDVTTVAPSDGQVLGYHAGLGIWRPSTPSGGGGAGISHPADVNALTLWLDPSDAGSVTLDGSSRVELLEDGSPAGADAAQPTAGSRPPLVALGGLNWLDFSTGNHYLITDGPFPAWVTARTTWVVIYLPYASNPGGRRTFMEGFPNYYQGSMEVDNAGHISLFGGSGTSVTEAAGVLDVPFQQPVVVCASWRAGGPVWSEIDGAQSGSAASGGTPSSSGYSGFHIGTYRDANGRWFDGYVGEIVNANQDYDYDNRLAMAEYLLNKWT